MRQTSDIRLGHRKACTVSSDGTRKTEHLSRPASPYASNPLILNGGTDGTSPAIVGGMAIDIRVTVVSVEDGEVFQVFECSAEDIGDAWFLALLSDDVHPWRRFRVFVTVAGTDTTYGVKA